MAGPALACNGDSLTVARNSLGSLSGVLTWAMSPPRGNNRDFVSYKPLVQWLCFTWRRSWLLVHRTPGLRPRVLLNPRHVNHAPPSYNYNIDHVVIVVCGMSVPAVDKTDGYIHIVVG